MRNSYYAAILTLYDKECRIDEDAQRSYIRFLIEKKVRGFFPCGTSGEYINLSNQENLRILELVLEENRNGLPVIPCASTASFYNTVELIQQMERRGVKEVSVCPPYYTPLRQTDILDYYLSILKETRVGIYLYNIPAFTNAIELDTFEKLLDNPRIRGIKDSSGSMKNISRYISMKNKRRDDFRVLTGTDEIILPALCGGCYGSVSALSGIIPEVHNLLYDSYKKDLPFAQKLQVKITELASECEKLIFPVGYKLALEARGFSMPAFRQNVEEQVNQDVYEEKRAKIHQLVYDLLSLANENTGYVYKGVN